MITPLPAISPRQKMLLVVLPALNEGITLKAVIDRIPRQIPGIGTVEVLVVDDGSTDDTVAASKAAGAHVVSHGNNRGVGAAMQTGLDEAVRRRADYMVNIDSDGQFSPEDIPTLLAPLLAGQAEFATASRFLDPKLVPVMPLVKRIGNWGMARIVSTLSGKRFEDVSCGFRAYTRETMLKLVLTGEFTYTQESILVLAQRRVRMMEVPLAVRGVREHGESRVASNLFRYAYRTSSILYSVVRDYSPHAIFHTAAALMLAVAMALGAFFFGHYLVVGAFTPHLWAGFLAAFLAGMAVLVWGLGQIAVMIARLRHMHERELYILRRHVERHEDES